MRTCQCIYRCEVGTDNWVQCNDSPIKICKYPVPGLFEGHSYYFRVRAVNSHGISKASRMSQPIAALDPTEFEHLLGNVITSLNNTYTWPYEITRVYKHTQLIYCAGQYIIGFDLLNEYYIDNIFIKFTMCFCFWQLRNWVASWTWCPTMMTLQVLNDWLLFGVAQMNVDPRTSERKTNTSLKKLSLKGQFIQISKIHSIGGAI